MSQRISLAQSNSQDIIASLRKKGYIVKPKKTQGATSFFVYEKSNKKHLITITLFHGKVKETEVKQVILAYRKDMVNGSRLVSEIKPYKVGRTTVSSWMINFSAKRYDSPLFVTSYLFVNETAIEATFLHGKNKMMSQPQREILNRLLTSFKSSGK
ncbi:MAG: hypothetical protein JNJ45_05805 [Chthonomonas sp.]|nr:hypothetical protein [Chthonomonas sp.]